MTTFVMLCTYFKIAFALLGVITRTRNKFVETVAVVERCFLAYTPNNELKKQPFRIYLSLKLAYGRKQEKRKGFFVPDLQYYQSE